MIKKITVLICVLFALPFYAQEILSITNSNKQVDLVDSQMYRTIKGENITQFLAQTYGYPQEALDDDISGVIILEFIVEPDGFVTDVKIIQKLCEACDQEAIRVIKSTQYVAIKNNDIPVRARFRVPIRLITM